MRIQKEKSFSDQTSLTDSVEDKKDSEISISSESSDEDIKVKLNSERKCGVEIGLPPNDDTKTDDDASTNIKIEISGINT